MLPLPAAGRADDVELDAVLVCVRVVDVGAVAVPVDDLDVERVCDGAVDDVGGVFDGVAGEVFEAVADGDVDGVADGEVALVAFVPEGARDVVLLERTDTAAGAFGEDACEVLVPPELDPPPDLGRK